MQLVAYGAQDIYLTGNPMITFFKTVYRRHTNFAMECIRQTFNGSVGFNNTVRATISRNGDLISGAFLKVTVPNRTDGGWVDALGHFLVRRVDVEIGGQLIDRHYGDWLEIWSQLTVSDNQADCYNQLTGADGVLSTAGAGRGALLNTNNQSTLYVPLQFWFCRNVGLSLPLIALQYHEVVITLEIESEANVTREALVGVTASDLAVELWVDYIYLDTDERRRFAQVSHEYLIEQVQFSGDEAFSNTNQQITLNFNHPVKELIWVSRLSESTTGKHWANYTTTQRATPTSERDPLGNAGANAGATSRNITQAAILRLNGHDRFATRLGSYFNMVQAFEHHTSIPSSPGINVYSFALKPEDHQPSGTCNFSRIDNARLDITISGNLTDNGGAANGDGITKVFAVNYNVLRIMSGMGGLAYSN
jgi:hypothetical protein